MTSLIIPERFATTILGAFGKDGSAWLERLPELVEQCALRWSLTIEGAIDNLSLNYLVWVRREDGSRAVLKLSVVETELSSEIAALQYFDGQGCARLYQSNRELGAFLIEALEPGEMLATLEDDDQATLIAAGVMEKLWRPAPAGLGDLTSLESRLGVLQRLHDQLDRGSGPLAEALLGRAEGLFAELVSSAGDLCVLHGDLQHHNILSAGREPWLAIDPKGVIGEPAYELGAFLYNPQPEFSRRSNLERVLRWRIDYLCERLGLDRRRVVGYGLAQAALSACFLFVSQAPGWEGVARVAEELAGLVDGGLPFGGVSW